MAAVQVKSYASVVPMIYAYTTPGVPAHDGWTKIGYTERDVDKRIREQTHTANIEYKVEWKKEARYTDGSEGYFDDHDFHNFLTQHGVEREKGTEWFRIDPKKPGSISTSLPGRIWMMVISTFPRAAPIYCGRNSRKRWPRPWPITRPGPIHRNFSGTPNPGSGRP